MSRRHDPSQPDLFASQPPEESRTQGAAPDNRDGPLSVSALNELVKGLLEASFPRVSVWGEVSNLSKPRSGHIYFTLKDAEAQVSCVIWRSLASRMRFALEDGMELLVHGPVNVYLARGTYQVNVQALEPRGVGALQLAFEQLRMRLFAEGLFDEERKRPLPFLPRRIALVTSPRGAAIQDMLRTILDRFPPAHLLVYPVPVQGSEAAPEIARAIEDLNRWRICDVMIVGRGGGSLEDLWAFNEEIVARAIFASEIPVVSAVGHEVDLTIADLVADRRAKTPTDAGVLVVPSLEELLDQLDRGRELLDRAADELLERHGRTIELLARAHGLGAFVDRISSEAQILDELSQRMDRGLDLALERMSQNHRRLGERLHGLSPLAVLDRGYTVTQLDDGRVVRRIDDAPAGELLTTRLHDGSIRSRVV